MNKLFYLFAVLLLCFCSDVKTTGTADTTDTQIALNGRVLSQNNVGVSGVVAKIAKTDFSDTTDAEGKYEILVSSDSLTNLGFETYNLTDSVDIINGSVKVNTLPVVNWVDTLPDVYLIQRSINGKLTGDIDKVTGIKAVLTSFIDTARVENEYDLWLNKQIDSYNSFVYFPNNGAADSFQIQVKVITGAGSVTGYSDVLTFNSNAGDIEFSEFYIFSSVPTVKIIGVEYVSKNVYGDDVVSLNDSVSIHVTGYDQFGGIKGYVWSYDKIQWFFNADTTIRVSCNIEGIMRIYVKSKDYDNLTSLVDSIDVIVEDLTGLSESEDINIDTLAFIDSRDLKLYSAISIGSLAVMAENLRYDPKNEIYKSYKCPNNQAIKCEEYGYLYSWKVSTQQALTSDSNEEVLFGPLTTLAGICPEGWHVPNKEEWGQVEDLLKRNYSNIDQIWKNIRSTNTWGQSQWIDSVETGTNTFGFNAKATGLWSYEKTGGYTYHSLGQRAFWWSSTLVNNEKAIVRGIYETPSFLETTYDVEYLFAVRCFRDDDSIAHSNHASIELVTRNDTICSSNELCQFDVKTVDQHISGIFYIDYESDGVIDSISTTGEFILRYPHGGKYSVSWGFIDDAGMPRRLLSTYVTYNVPPRIHLDSTITSWGMDFENDHYLFIELNVDDENGLEDIVKYVVTIDTITVISESSDIEINIQSSQPELSITVIVFDSNGDSTIANGNILVPLLDERTGLQYPVTKIGKQIWMGKDLSYCETSNTVCWGWGVYTDTCESGTKTYYSHEEATKGVTSNTNPSGVQGVCPSGWHIPSNSEWTEMAIVIADSLGVEYSNDLDLWQKIVDELRNDAGWYVWRGGYYVDNGSDKFDFHGFENGDYCGVRYGTDLFSHWSYLSDANWLSTSISEDDNDFYVWYISKATNASKITFGDSSCKYAVRCIKD